LTSVAKDRLPVFRTDSLKTITCNALDEARRSGGFAVYAYVIMPDHLHLVMGSARRQQFSFWRQGNADGANEADSHGYERHEIRINPLHLMS
jgi:REP element-mobilizing transposase RayT